MAGVCTFSHPITSFLLKQLASARDRALTDDAVKNLFAIVHWDKVFAEHHASTNINPAMLPSLSSRDKKRVMELMNFIVVDLHAFHSMMATCPEGGSALFAQQIRNIKKCTEDLTSGVARSVQERSNDLIAPLVKYKECIREIVKDTARYTGQANRCYLKKAGKVAWWYIVSMFVFVLFYAIYALVWSWALWFHQPKDIKNGLSYLFGALGQFPGLRDASRRETILKIMTLGLFERKGVGWRHTLENYNLEEYLNHLFYASMGDCMAYGTAKVAKTVRSVFRVLPLGVQQLAFVSTLVGIVNWASPLVSQVYLKVFDKDGKYAVIVSKVAEWLARCVAVVVPKVPVPGIHAAIRKVYSCNTRVKPLLLSPPEHKKKSPRENGTALRARLEGYTVPVLRTMVKEKGGSPSKLRKADLVDALLKMSR